MFIRIKKINGIKAAIQIVENHRVGSTTKQQVLRHIGTGHNEEQIKQLKQLAEVLMAKLENKTIEKQTKQHLPKFAKTFGELKTTEAVVKVADLIEKQRYILGIHDIYGFIYDHLGFTNLFTRPEQRIEAACILKEIVLARIARPVSKRATVALLTEQFAVNLDLDRVYKMMDKMDDFFYERIQKRALTETLKLTGGKLKILFYDATTLYFESFTEDELKQNGYSKDLKFNQPQVLLALFVTEHGLPVGYELFPGATFEGHTLIPVLEKLKDRYQLEEVVFVADRGLFNEENIKKLEEKNFKYVVGAKIKNVNKKLQEEILNKDNYESVNYKIGRNCKIKNEQPIIQRFASFTLSKKQKLIVHYHSGRAKKDEYDRNKAIEKLQKKLSKSKNPKSLLNNYGYKKYITINGITDIGINVEKIEEAKCWDGLLGISTNIIDKDPEQLLNYYRGLWQIEESFRINKHDLRMRPIYHWKPHRIKAHIAISFIAFVCVRYLEYLISIKEVKISPEIIRQTLLQVQASVIEDKSTGRQFLLTSNISDNAKKLYKLIGIKLPSSTSEIKSKVCGA